MSAERHIEGYCPACGKASLFRGDGGHITCGVIECPDPCIVDKILSDRETEHIVVFRPEGFDIQHPLRERADGKLFDCDLLQHCSNLDGPPTATGRYRAVMGETRWMFYPVKAAA